MRPDSIAWERAAEVRDAAAAWRRVGAIDEPTEERIRDAFPDPCTTPSAVWRVLTAAIVTAVIVCAFGAVILAIEPSERALPIFLLAGAAVCLVATERLEASPRHARRGAAGATAFWTVALFLPGLGFLSHDVAGMSYDDAFEVTLAAGALAWGAACWRWGSPVFGGLAAASLFAALGRSAHARLLWLLVGALLVALAARRLDRAAWAPSHRRAAMVLTVIGIAAVYAAVNVYSFDERLLEGLRRFWTTFLAGIRPAAAPGLPGFRAVSVAGTVFVPLGVLAWGLASRRTVLLDTGIVLVALSLVTLRHYVHLAPLWVVLTAAGGGLVALALVAERALRRAPRGEIGGYTADPLFSDEQRQQALQIVPVVATFTPAAGAAEDKGLGGGGRFGGGGATEKF
jgi:hypothetical protein